jgi:tRNA-splicing ligase RtcB (3'-phosphate/5'-hydroxy nucleic acid ligase)
MTSQTVAPGIVRLERVDAVRWRIPRDPQGGMRVDGLVFADEELMRGLKDDPCLTQVANVATLPGIVGASLGMPDLHWGYGFPIGGVAALRQDGGVVSPGGIGFDINCGVRLLRSDLVVDEVGPVLDRLADRLYGAVPGGVGAHAGRRLSAEELDAVLQRGAEWAVAAGFGLPDDLELTEEGGRLVGADASCVSARARARGANQLGTLGSGNHFLEVQAVDAVLDPESAEVFGLRAGGVTVMVHCGSRGLGHQVCTDYVGTMDRAMRQYGISVPDRQLACAPIGSPQADDYLGAMAAAANFAWANRQLIADAVRDVFAEIFGPATRLPMVYDLSHNIAKFESHLVDGRERQVCVHRKGATRAFPAGHPAVPERYREVGHPVLIPGDMGRHSIVAAGLPGAMAETFGSTCHGAGRTLSRHAARRQLRGVDVGDQLQRQGIVVRAGRRDLLAEEASLAYKDVEAVVGVAAGAGHIRPVVRLRPLAVIKG